MQLIQLLSGAALFGLTVAQGYTLPEVSDGFYGVRVDENGTEIHEQLLPGSSPASDKWTFVTSFQQSGVTPSSKRDATGVSDISRRADTDCGPSTGLYEGWGCFTTWCGCGFNLNHGDTDAAVADLEAQADRLGKIGHPYLAHYSIRGGTVAFACNPDYYEDAPYNGWFVVRILQQVTKKCGLYVAGTSTYSDIVNENIFPLIGYMQYYSGLPFCDKATGSGQGHC
ncbi:hypothetical protein N0V90_000640 [Kalmusia sp. IMI 367209]|nr:hypothetical protein N0V90_000640 [Kalmusia sp. IMI 367209]